MKLPNQHQSHFLDRHHMMHKISYNNHATIGLFVARMLPSMLLLECYQEIVV
jgi:hypothetical protein